MEKWKVEEQKFGQAVTDLSGNGRMMCSMEPESSIISKSRQKDRENGVSVKGTVGSTQLKRHMLVAQETKAI